MENNNQQAGEYLDQIFEMWSVQSVDEESGVEYRHPTSKEQVEKGRELLNQARACNPDDPDVKARLEELQGILDDATTKRFGGNRMFLYGVIIAVLLWGGFYIYSGFGDMGRNYTPEQGQQLLNSTISSYERSIEYVQNKQMDESDKEDQIADYKEKIEDLKEHDGESFADKKESEAFWRGAKAVVTGLFYFLLLALYYWSAQMPQYLINKRQKEIAAMAKGTSWAKKILFGIVGIFLSMPIVEYYDKWSDGSVTYSEDNLPMGMMQLALKYGIPVLIIIIVAYVIIAILPILIAINVLRNKYPNLIKDVTARVFKKS